MDIPTASAAMSILNSAIGSAKNAIEIAKGRTDTEMREAVNSILNDIIDLKLQIVSLDDENRSLQRQLAERGEFHHDKSTGYFFRKNDAAPYCPKCFEGSDKPVHLSPPYQWNGKTRRDCAVCGKLFYDQQSDVSTEVLSSRVRNYDPYTS